MKVTPPTVKLPGLQENNSDVMSLENRIKLELRGRKPDEIRELNLDNSKSTALAGLTEEFENLEALSLINVGLTTLKGFPSLPNLRKLELSDNRISSGLEHLKSSPKLQYLNVSGNKLKEISSLEPLKELVQLKALDLFNCEIEELVEDHREKIFELLPNLVYLDGLDKNDVEMPDDSGDGDEDDDDDDDDDDESDDDDDIDEEDDNEVVGVVEGEGDDDDDDDDDGEELGLAYLQKQDIDDDESDGDDFAPVVGQEEDDDDEIDEEDDEDDEGGGKRGNDDDEDEPDMKKKKVAENDDDD